MGHVVDRWTVPGPDGRRVPGPRHGRGRRWLARWTAHGVERSKAFETKSSAQAYLAQVTVDIVRGEYLAPTRLTVSEYVAEWLPRQLHQRASTRAQAESRLRLHVLPRIGHQRLGDVRRGDIQDLLAAADLAPATIHTTYAYVRAVFASAVDDRLIPSSPCTRIRLPRVRARQHDPLTPDEVRDLAAAVRPNLQGMVWLAAGTGMRPGELRGLTVDRIRQGRVVVDRQLSRDSRADRPVWGPLKTDSSLRTLALAPSTWTRLQQHLDTHPPSPDGLVFTSRSGRPLTTGLLADAWTASGARGRGWHDLRHHHASLLIAAGLSARAVADRLGHADPAETLRTYSHLWPTDSERILEAVDQAYA